MRNHALPWSQMRLARRNPPLAWRFQALRDKAWSCPGRVASSSRSDAAWSQPSGLPVRFVEATEPLSSVATVGRLTTDKSSTRRFK